MYKAKTQKVDLIKFSPTGSAPVRACMCVRQSDQIGRIFSHWVIVYFGNFFKNPAFLPILLAIFPRLRICIDFEEAWVWATFWATLSQAHPVTLTVWEDFRQSLFHPSCDQCLSDTNNWQST
jgi:hypothetical protein